MVEDFDPEVIFHEASITDTTETDQIKMLADNVEPFETLLAIAVERGEAGVGVERHIYGHLGERRGAREAAVPAG